MVTLFCPAKINLFLAIHGKDDSGFHEIETVLIRTGQVHDLIHIEDAEELTFECQDIPGEGNTVMQALRILEKETGKPFNYHIRLEKNIPPRSGLGGGSSDAAAMLIFLNEHQNLGLSHDRLMELAAEIGMDVPFFVSGQPVALASHYGEVIEPLPDLPKNLQIKIHQTGKEVSTKEAYERWDKEGQPSGKTADALIEAVKKGNAWGIIQNLHNDFQSINPLPGSPAPSSGMILAGSGGAFAILSANDTKNKEKQK